MAARYAALYLFTIFCQSFPCLCSALLHVAHVQASHVIFVVLQWLSKGNIDSQSIRYSQISVTTLVAPLAKHSRFCLCYTSVGHVRKNNRITKPLALVVALAIVYSRPNFIPVSYLLRAVHLVCLLRLWLTLLFFLLALSSFVSTSFIFSFCLFGQCGCSIRVSHCALLSTLCRPCSFTTLFNPLSHIS